MSAKTDWLNPGFWFLPLTHTFVLGPLRAGSPGSFLPGWRGTQHLAAWLAQSRHPWNPEPSSLALSWWLSKGRSPTNGIRRKMRKRPDIPASQGVSREPLLLDVHPWGQDSAAFHTQRVWGLPGTATGHLHRTTVTEVTRKYLCG